jgi:hypothetical protein
MSPVVDGGNQGTPDTIVASRPIPETDLPLCPETVELWLADGGGDHS